VGQVLMKTGRVRRLPALMVLLPSKRDNAAVRQLVVYGETTNVDSRSAKKKKKKSAKAQHKSNPNVVDLMSAWTAKKLTAVIRNATTVAASGLVGDDAGPRVGSRFIGSLSDVKLLAVAAEAHDSTTLSRDAPLDEEPRRGRFVNPEGWSNAEDEFSNMEEHTAIDGCVAGSVQCGADSLPWHIPAALRKSPKVSKAAPSGTNGGAAEVLNVDAETSPQVDVASFSVDVFLRDTLMEPRPSSSRADDDDRTTSLRSRQPFIGWNALRDANPMRDTRAEVFDL
jgi:hypothetical protein